MPRINALEGRVFGDVGTYDKIKAKAGRAADFARLAKTVAADLGDKAQAAAIINETRA